VPGLLIIVALFVLMYVLMIRPQRAKAQAQQRLLGEEGDGEDEDGGDVVEGEAELVVDHPELPAGVPELPAGVEEVNEEGETVNPGAAEDAAAPGRS